MIYSAYNFFISGLIIISSLVLTISIFKKNKEDLHIAILIFFWHLFFAYVHHYYSLYYNYASDSYNYYFGTLENSFSSWLSFNLLNVGSNFVKNIVYIFHRLISFSYFNVFLLFSMIGYYGVLLLYKNLVKISNNHYKLIILSLALMPSMNFWTCGISKDLITFFSLNYFLYTTLRRNRINFFPLVITIFLISLVRPYVALILLFSYFISLLFKRRKILKDYLMLSTSLIFSFFLYLIFETIYGIKINFFTLNSTYNSLIQIIENRQVYNINASSFIDLRSMNFVEKIFAYYFRPFPLEANNLMQILVSIENLYFLLLFIFVSIFSIKFIYRNIFKPEVIFRNINYKYFVNILYIVMLTILLSQTTANFGIASRQKYMLLPFIYFMIFTFMFKNKSDKNLNTK